MIFVTGDTHGSYDIHKLSAKKFPEGKLLSKSDYVIICGDFGLQWDDSSEEKWWLNWLDERPWTTLFCDGNHECHTMLNDLPLVEMFGSKVGKVNDSVYHLKRGEVYNIDGKKFFVMGGAESTDKASRVEHISWWKEEIPSCSEFDKGLRSLDEHNWKVDYVISHTAPKVAIMELFKQTNQYMFERFDAVTQYFDHIENLLDFKHWYFGHFHADIRLDDNFTCVYNDIVRLGD